MMIYQQQWYFIGGGSYDPRRTRYNVPGYEYLACRWRPICELMTRWTEKIKIRSTLPLDMINKGGFFVFQAIQYITNTINIIRKCVSIGQGVCSD